MSTKSADATPVDPLWVKYTVKTLKGTAYLYSFGYLYLWKRGKYVSYWDDDEEPLKVQSYGDQRPDKENLSV